MGRPIFCRWCQAEDKEHAGERPGICPTCGNIGRWGTVQHVGLLERRKHEKGPRVPFSTTQQDYMLFLKRIKVSAD